MTTYAAPAPDAPTLSALATTLRMHALRLTDARADVVSAELDAHTTKALAVLDDVLGHLSALAPALQDHATTLADTLPGDGLGPEEAALRAARRAVASRRLTRVLEDARQALDRATLDTEVRPRPAPG